MSAVYSGVSTIATSVTVTHRTAIVIPVTVIVVMSIAHELGCDMDLRSVTTRSSEVIHHLANDGREVGAVPLDVDFHGVLLAGAVSAT